MKLQSLKGGLLSKRGGGGFTGGGFTAAPVKTVAPVMASQPGAYGGPPGSFITSGACPPGYSRSAMHRGPGQPQQYRCIPRVAAAPKPAPAPAPVSRPSTTSVRVSPKITVSPAIQTQVSPQISPVMTMQQDSPGASVAAQPQQAGSPQSAATGIPTPPSGDSRTTEDLRRQLAEEAAAREARQAETMMRMFSLFAPQQPTVAPPPQQFPAPRPEPEPEPIPAPTPAPMPEPRVMQTLAPIQRDTSFLDRQAQPIPVGPPPEKGLNIGLILLAAAAGLFLLNTQGGTNEPRKSTRGQRKNKRRR